MYNHQVIGILTSRIFQTGWDFVSKINRIFFGRGKGLVFQYVNPDLVCDFYSNECFDM